MPDDVLDALFLSLSQLPKERICVVWHGGEPLLAPQSFYQRALDTARRHSKRYRFVLQTNGTLLDGSWASFLTENGVGVGVSLDGPPAIHNAHRRLKSGKHSFDRVLGGIRRLREQGEEPMVLCVVTEDVVNQPEALFEFFVANGLYKFDFLPCLSLDPGSLLPNRLGVSAEAFGRFMTRMFDLWRERDDTRVEIRYLRNVLQAVLGGRPTMCDFGHCHRFISVDTNGDVYPCDLFIGIEEFCMGNIIDNPLIEIWGNERFERFKGIVSSRRHVCSGCEWEFACRGGCTMHWYLGGQDLVTSNVYCEARKAIFTYVWDEMSRLTSQGAEPSQIYP
jgi:uncharacterized protein